ncbi:hypothetical protein FWF93_03185 [Candidatus Saccharibacteria bacterium]|nr:hypothetical protein [Candidatus Saccharibacteria bacterium]
MRRQSKIQEAEIVSAPKTSGRAKPGANDGMEPGRKRKLTRKAIIISVLLVIGYGVWDNWQFLWDQYVIWQNPPSSEVMAMAERTTMNDYAQRIFYASVPQLNDAATFNENCTNNGSELVLLGCFYRGKIYIFNITDEEIAGAMYVTAAHEMLHAAYVRLDPLEKIQIDAQLEMMYEQLNNTELNELVANYEESEPGQKHNELHSIIGTEYAELTPALESYYARYFDDQDAVVALSNQYKQVFKDLENAQKELEVKMAGLKAKIDEDMTSYDMELIKLNVDIDSFNKKNSSGGFVTDAQFNSARNALLARKQALDDLAGQIRVDVDQYNEWAEEYNKIGGRGQELNRSFNSQAAEIE